VRCGENENSMRAKKPIRSLPRIYKKISMANLFYNDRLIIAYASLQQSTKLWSAGAEITWKIDGQRYSHTIYGLPDRFKTAEEAERFVVNFAKSWIDANP
jgi:hypothetical protein